MPIFGRPRYSLKALLACTFVVSLPCWLVTQRLESKRRERASIAALEAEGGFIWYNSQGLWVDDHAESVPPGPAWARRILGHDFFDHVIRVMIPKESSQSLTLRVLEEFNEAEAVILCQEITESILSRLRIMSGLRYLDISSNTPSERVTQLRRSLPDCKVYHLLGDI
jgi:hypothetical protein